MDTSLLADAEKMLTDSMCLVDGSMDRRLEIVRARDAADAHPADPYAGQRRMVTQAIAAGDMRLASALLSMR